jgi:hypothetical protein
MYEMESILIACKNKSFKFLMLLALSVARSTSEESEIVVIVHHLTHSSNRMYMMRHTLINTYLQTALSYIRCTARTVCGQSDRNKLFSWCLAQA